MAGTITVGELLSDPSSSNKITIGTGTTLDLVSGAGSVTLPPEATDAASLTGALPSGVMPSGSVVQYGHATNGDSLSLSTTSWVDSGVSLSFTPVLASSRLIVWGVFNISAWSTSTHHSEVLYRIEVDGTSIIQESSTYCSFPDNTDTQQHPQTAVYTNSNTTAKTIKLRVKNSDTNSSSAINQYSGYCTITVMEVSA